MKEEWPLNRGHFFDARSELPEVYSIKHKTLDQKVSCGERPEDDGDALNGTPGPPEGVPWANRRIRNSRVFNFEHRNGTFLRVPHGFRLVHMGGVP